VRVEEELTEEELLALAQAQDQAQVQDEERAQEAQTEEVLPASVRRYSEVAGAVQTLVARRFVNFEALTSLSDEERTALEDLEHVVKGVDGGRFLFAETRLVALNNSLAVLQPALGVAMHGAGIDVLQSSFERVVDDLNALRDHLISLESAEDEHFERIEQRGAAEDDEDDDESDDGDDKPADKPAAKPRKDKKPPSVYDPTAPDEPDAPRPAPTAYDPAAADAPAPPEPPSVYDPAAADVPVPAEPPSIYDPAAPDGPDAPEPPSIYEPEGPA
jgi:hypothetical protein